MGDKSQEDRSNDPLGLGTSFEMTQWAISVGLSVFQELRRRGNLEGAEAKAEQIDRAIGEALEQRDWSTQVDSWVSGLVEELNPIRHDVRGVQWAIRRLLDWRLQGFRNRMSEALPAPTTIQHALYRGRKGAWIDDDAGELGDPGRPVRHSAA